MNYLLDTNIVSELVKPRPEANVVSWVAGLQSQQLHISVLTLGEIRKGIEKKTSGPRRQQLELWLRVDLREWFHGRILSLDEDICERWGIITAQAQQPLPVIDGLLAATCLARDLVFVTRNTKDVERVYRLQWINPWLTK